MNAEKYLWRIIAVLGIVPLVTIIFILYKGFMDWFVITSFALMTIISLMAAVILFQNKEQRQKTFRLYEKIINLGTFVLFIQSLVMLFNQDFSLFIKMLFLSILLFFINKYGWQSYWDRENKQEKENEDKEESRSKSNRIFLIMLSIFFIINVLFKLF